MQNRIKIGFLLVLVLLLPAFVYAGDSEVKTYMETGKRSTDEDFEEATVGEDYKYQKYYFKFKQQVSDVLRYTFISQVYDKDYNEREDLDNQTRTLQNNWTKYLKDNKEETLKLDVKLKYKQKRYSSSPISQYDQTQVSTGLTYKQKKNYTLNFEAGLKDINYIASGQKDVFSFFGKLGLKKYFLDKKIKWINRAKIEKSARTRNSRDRTKSDLTSGLDYKPDLAWLKKIVVRSKFAERNTKSEEDRDDDLDYDYWQHYIKSTHKLSESLQTSLKYQYFKRDYLASNLDNRGYYIQNTWRYDFLKSSEKSLYSNITLQHKRVDYSLTPEYDYKVDSFDIKGVYDLKKNWKFTGSLQTDFYNYQRSTSDKKAYYAKLGIEKAFLDDNLKLILDLKYKYSDYKQQNNKSFDGARLTVQYEF